MSVEASIAPCGSKPIGACSERCMPRSGHERGGDQQGAQRNLQAEQKIAQREAAEENGTRRTLHHAGRIRLPDLPRRQQPEENAAGERKQQCEPIDARIRDRP